MRIYLTICCCFGAAIAKAQPGIAEMQQAKKELSSSFFSAFDFGLTLALLFGLIGALGYTRTGKWGKTIWTLPLRVGFLQHFL